MSRIFKSILWVLIYSAIYFVISIVVGVIASIFIFVYYAISYGVSEIDVSTIEKAMYSYTGILQFISYLLIMGLISIIIYARTKRMGESLWIRKPQKNIVLPVIFCGISASFIVPVVLHWLTVIFPMDGLMQQYSQLMEDIDFGNPFINILLIAVLAPIFEEFFFRGAIYKELRSATPIWVAIVLQALIFGIFHMNVVQGLYAFGLGIILGLVYEWSRSLWVPIIFHAVFNAIGTSADYIPIFNNDIVVYILAGLSVIVMIFTLKSTRKYRRLG